MHIFVKFSLPIRELFLVLVLLCFPNIVKRQCWHNPTDRKQQKQLTLAALFWLAIVII